MMWNAKFHVMVLFTSVCMANMGGAGDLAVLGAAKLMNLISYAQI